MTQFGGDRNNPYQQQEQYQQPHQQQYAQPPRTSVLAVAAFVCSIIFCCPLTTIPGVILGVISVATIGKNPALRGKGFAIAAIIIGLLATTLQGGAGWWIAKFSFGFISFVNDDLSTAIGTGYNGDYSGLRVVLGSRSATSASDAEIQEFLDELRSRFGGFRSLQIDQTDPSFMQQSGSQLMAPLVLNFESGQATGMAYVTYIPPIEFELDSIEIQDGTDVIVFP